MGLRQGCPLSHFLFVLCSDVLSRSLNDLVTVSALCGYQPWRHGACITHLMFADDLILVVKAISQNAQRLKKAVEDYCLQSEQRVNVQKLQLQFSGRIDPRIKQQLLCLLNIPHKEGTWNYLGLPLSCSRLSRQDFNPLFDRIYKRLDAWKWKHLSQAGCIVLLQATLNSSYIYLMTNVPIPITVLRDLEKIFKSFLWGHEPGTRKLHLLSWKVDCMDRSQGGLGIHSIRARREACMGKAATNLMWLIGNGWSISLLDDPWMSNIPISRSAMPINVDLCEEDWKVACLLGANGSWDAELVNHLFPPDIVGHILATAIPRFHCEDVFVSHIFDSKRVKVKEIWCLNVAPRVKVFRWKVCWGCLPSKVSLSSRGFVHQQTTMCDLYSSDSEDLEHCLLKSPRVTFIWNEMNQSYLQIPHFNSLVQLINFTSKNSNSNHSKSLVCYATWSIWNARNHRIFHDIRHDSLTIFVLAQQLANEFIGASTAINTTMAV
ncbi:uncharacterized protein [Elaeis guineensis]|uniref:uncharacterized protein n=1 Tax=Elaeis guineensis var. tenera TaxID=51953 RepID=UPI003C6CF335